MSTRQTDADRTLVKRLKQELAIVGSPNRDGACIVAKSKWRDKDGTFSNHVDYFAPRRLNEDGNCFLAYE